MSTTKYYNTLAEMLADTSAAEGTVGIVQATSLSMTFNGSAWVNATTVSTTADIKELLTELSEKVDSVKSDIENITVSPPSFDFSQTTLTANLAADGYKFYNASGTLVEGSLASLTSDNITKTGSSVTIPEGFYTTADVVVEIETAIDMSDSTISANNTLDGIIGYDKDGNRFEGTIANAEIATQSGSVVTIPAGYVPSEYTLEIPEAGEVSISGNVVTIPIGYIRSERTATVAEAQAPTVNGNIVTVYPGYVTTQQTIETEGGGGSTTPVDFSTGLIRHIVFTENGASEQIYNLTISETNGEYINYKQHLRLPAMTLLADQYGGYGGTYISCPAVADTGNNIAGLSTGSNARTMSALVAVIGTLPTSENNHVNVVKYGNGWSGCGFGPFQPSDSSSNTFGRRLSFSSIKQEASHGCVSSLRTVPCDDKWHLFTCTCDTEYDTIYVDGIVVCRAETIRDDNTDQPLTIGYSNVAISDVRIYDRALTADDVLALYQHYSIPTLNGNLIITFTQEEIEEDSGLVGIANISWYSGEWTLDTKFGYSKDGHPAWYKEHPNRPPTSLGEDDAKYHSFLYWDEGYGCYMLQLAIYDSWDTQTYMASSNPSSILAITSFGDEMGFYASLYTAIDYASDEDE